MGAVLASATAASRAIPHSTPDTLLFCKSQSCCAGPGSVAILTSRSRQALTNEGREGSVKVYQTETLPMPAAKQLLQFCFTAPDPPLPWWEQFLDTSVQRCYGLPISLKVCCGCSLVLCPHMALSSHLQDVNISSANITICAEQTKFSAQRMT